MCCETEKALAPCCELAHCLVVQSDFRRDVWCRRDMQKSLLLCPFPRKWASDVTWKVPLSRIFLRRPLPMWTDGQGDSKPENFKISIAHDLWLKVHQRISPSPTNVSRSSFFPLEKPLLVQRQTNIVTSCLMILLKEDRALATSVVSSLKDRQWHNAATTRNDNGTQTSHLKGWWQI